MRCVDLTAVLMIMFSSHVAFAQAGDTGKDDAAFWALVGRLKAACCKEDTIYYADARAAFTFFEKEKPEDVLIFWKGLDRRLTELYRWDIWAVGAILGGRVGTECFTDYGVWVILQGRDFYDGVLKDPAHAATAVPEGSPSSRFNFTYLLGAVRSSVRRATGKDDQHLHTTLPETKPAGKEWSWEDLKARQPEIWERFYVKRDRRPSWTDLAAKSDHDVIWLACGPTFDWVDIYSCPEYFKAQYAQLNPAQRALHAVVWMREEVGNGGYDQFFYNHTGIVAFEALKGLEVFGATEQHDALAKVMAAFPDGAPSMDRHERLAQLQARWPRGEGKRGKLIDDEFKGPIMWRDFEKLESQLAGYVRSHPDQFLRPK